MQFVTTKVGIMTRLMIVFPLIIFSFITQASLVLKSYNIRNFSSDKTTNLPLLKKILTQNRAHVMAVQEIKNTKLFKKFIESEFKHFSYKAVLSKCGGRGGQKLGFIYDSHRLELENFKEDLSLAGNEPSCNGSSRPAAIALFKDKLKNHRFAAISVHLKAGGCQKCFDKRVLQLKKLSLIIRDLNAKGIDKIVSMGDYNTTHYNKQSERRETFLDFVSHHRMKDTAMAMKCSSYWKGSNYQDQIEEPSLLDHILISDSFLAAYKEKRKVSLGVHCQRNFCKRSYAENMGQAYFQVSDHCPIGLHLK